MTAVINYEDKRVLAELKKLAAKYSKTTILSIKDIEALEDLAIADVITKRKKDKAISRKAFNAMFKKTNK